MRLCKVRTVVRLGGKFLAGDELAGHFDETQLCDCEMEGKDPVYILSSL
jgi:hypothetical protein